MADDVDRPAAHSSAVPRSTWSATPWAASWRASSPRRIRRWSAGSSSRTSASRIPRPRRAAPSPEGALPFDWRVVEQVRPEIDDPDPRWRDVVARIAAPTLVIGGGPSSSVPQDHVAELVGAVPDGRLVTVDAGHLVHATQTRRVHPPPADVPRRLADCSRRRMLTAPKITTALATAPTTNPVASVAEARLNAVCRAATSRMLRPVPR